MKMQEELERNTRLLGGRQALYMVAQSFVTADNTETYLGIEHLANLMMSNNDLETFWLRWEQIVSKLFLKQSFLRVSRRFSTTRFASMLI